MRPTSVRFSHAHGSASRRRSNFVVGKTTQKAAPTMTLAEKNAHAAQVTPLVVEAA